MYKLIFTASIVWAATAGCATNEIYIPPLETINRAEFKSMEISTQLKPYVAMFLEEMDKRKCNKAKFHKITRIVMDTDDVFTEAEKKHGGYITGLCFYPSKADPTSSIHIRASFPFSVISLMAVMFHELGHCALHRPHTAEMNVDTPEIMDAYVSAYDSIPPAEWERMKDSLFKGCK